MASFQALKKITKCVLVSEAHDVSRLTPVEPGKKVPGFTNGKMSLLTTKAHGYRADPLAGTPYSILLPGPNNVN